MIGNFREKKLSNGYANDWLEELKSKTNIVDIIGQYVRLTKKGSKHFGCCPFHNEKTGSFCVNEDAQFYHCFGCGVSGDVVKFVQEIESCTFMEACEMLAEKVNMEIPKFEKSNAPKIDKSESEKLYDCMHDAFGYYYANLRKNGNIAIEYLKSRGIDEDTMKYYGIGLSSNFDGMTTYLRLKGYTKNQLIDCGLIEGDNGKDPFSNRIIVPILNSFGKVVAFGGRIFQNEERRPKYKNSTNTILFDKSKTLYGLNFAKNLKKEHNLNEIILVEGYMDVISLGAKGIKNAVAGMGTALTEGQARELARLCKKIYVCYDGDGAGRKAAVRNVEILAAQQNTDIKIVDMPDGYDPDDYVKEFGTDGFMKLIDNALPLVDFKFKLIEDKVGLDSTNARARFASMASIVLASIEDTAERAVYAGEIAKKCQIAPESLLDKAKTTKIEKKSPEMPEIVIDSKNMGKIMAEQSLLNALLFQKSFAKIEQLQDEWFVDSEYKEIFEILCQREKANKKTNAGILLGLFPESKAVDGVVNFDACSDDKTKTKFYFDSALMLANNFLNEKMIAIVKAYEDEKDDNKKRDLMKQLGEIQQKKSLKNLEGKKLG